MKQSDRNGWKKADNRLLSKNAVAESINGEKMTFARYKINKPIEIALHSHDYEQIVYVVKGEMDFYIDDKLYAMSEGDVQVVLGNVVHSAKITKTPFESIESYYPVRTDL